MRRGQATRISTLVLVAAASPLAQPQWHAEPSASPWQAAQALAAPVGGEFQVNSYTTSRQGGAAVAAAADGAFVVVWGSDGSAGSDSDSSIQGQRYASDGSPVGGEFQVNTFTTFDQVGSEVSSAADGAFVVVWTSYIGLSGPIHGIQGQRYASDGSPLGGQFQVDSYTVGYRVRPAVAAAADGAFVVVWQGERSPGSDSSWGSIQGQRYASDGSPAGGQFQVNSYTTYRQEFPAVSAAADGAFVVVWHSYESAGPDSSLHSIQGQRYASDGSPAGGQFEVNSYTTSVQSRPAVSSAADGAFVVAWRSEGSAGSDSSQSSIQGQRYASDGSPAGGQFQVNSYTTDRQGETAVSVAADGAFVVAWKSEGSAGSDSSLDSVQGQQYASDGSPAGGQFQVNSYTTDRQNHPAVAATADGAFVVAWRSVGSAGSDSSSSSIQGQRYVGTEDCTPDATTLCLPEDDRFEVSVYYETVQAGGRMGDARAISLDAIGLSKGGVFVFSDPANPELLVKVLDGCAINDRYWVFYAATTNVGFVLTVTDTLALQTQVFINPDLNPADAVTDTQAFATCP